MRLKTTTNQATTTALAIAAPLMIAAETGRAVDVSAIEKRRLFEPSASELEREQSGHIYLYDGLAETDVRRAMKEDFDRIESMMFIRTRKTGPSGEILRDEETGKELIEDDGC